MPWIIRFAIILLSIKKGKNQREEGGEGWVGREGKED